MHQDNDKTSTPISRAALAACVLILCTVITLEVAGCRRAEAKGRVLPRREEGRLLEPNSFGAAWTNDIDVAAYGIPSRIYLRDDLVVLYTDQNVVYVLSATGGRTLWVTRDVVRPLERLWPPVLLDALNRFGAGVQRILVFPSNTSFVVFADTGERLQDTPIEHGKRALTSPSYGDAGVVYAGLGDPFGGRAAKIDPTRLVNPILLPRLLRGVVTGRPVVYEDRFFIADETGAVYAMTEEGNQAWNIQHFQTNGPVTADLTADADGLYVPSNDTTLYVLDRGTGRLIWRYFAEVQLSQPAFPVQGYVFLPVPGRGVVALSKSEGRTINREPIWTVESAREVLSHDDQNVYLLHRDGRIAAHSKATGKELFSTQRKDFVTVTRNLSGPRIYAATAAGEIVAIEPILTRGRVGRLVMSDVVRPESLVR
jgi:outer membrane protein assembly factor BamB